MIVLTGMPPMNTPDDPGHRDRQHADVEAAHAAHETATTSAATEMMTARFMRRAALPE